MMTLHHLHHSRSQRVLWLLEELGVPFDVKAYERHPDTMLAPPELRAVHALGKSPVITDGDVTVAETGAIVEYLVDLHGQGRLRPAAGTPEYLRYRHWLHFAEGSAQPQLLLKFHANRILGAAATPAEQAVAHDVLAKLIATTDTNLRNNLDFMEAELARSAWFAGDEFSAADVIMSFPIEVSVERAGLDASRPRLCSYLERIHVRPAYRRARERGGPYRFAP
jgi:glutathione S-transferase